MRAINPYLEILKKAQDTESSTTIFPDLLAECGLDNVDCPKCGNTGYILRQTDGELFSKECSCMAKRRSIRRLTRSNMSDMLSHYMFDSYETPDDYRVRVKHLAKKFAEDDTGWFFISGKSGSGKTHLCTAICSRLIERDNDVYYMKWRDESRSLKAIINTEEVDERLDKLKRVHVLYVDDFFKGGCNDADIRLAFEIINDRYNDSKLRTVISSEMTMEQIIAADEALGSRIYERSRGYMLSSPKENWRLRA